MSVAADTRLSRSDSKAGRLQRVLLDLLRERAEHEAATAFLTGRNGGRSR